MPEWTSQQKSAIDIRDCDLLVSAAAGSGKTAVLSERVLRRVTDKEKPVRVDKLLIVTFTNAAAAEMRGRIVEKIRQELKKDPGNRELSRQLALVPKANITTIHSFCLNIIRENFHLIDIDPSFGILDQGEKLLISVKLAREVINEMYEKHGKSFSHMSKWFAGGRDDVLGKQIVSLYEYLRSFENPAGWLESQVEKYNTTGDSARDLQWTELLKEKYKVQFTMAMSRYEELQEYARIGRITRYLETFDEDKNVISMVLAALAGDWEEICDTAARCSFSSIKPKDKGCDADLADICRDERKKIVDTCKESLQEIQSIGDKQAVEALRKTYPLMKLLQESVLLFEEKYKREKQKKNVLDFSDFEHIALALLADESLPVAAQLRKKFEEIYVDEYQDCNGVQEAIFSAIAKRVHGKSCNMFMVGDVKQSIYKFRQADPGIFIDKMHRYGNDGLQRKIVLNRNFRSRPEVINCINNLFESIMSERVGSLEYTEDEALYAGLKYPPCPHGETGGMPEILAAEAVGEEGGIEEKGLLLEARAVALKIHEMVGKYMVFDVKTGEYRPCVYRDFAILLRGVSGKSAVIEAELKNLGIPYFSDKGSGLFDTHETELLTLALNIVDNPLQDIPLVGFMRSAVVGFDEDELLRIRGYGKKGYFYNAVKKCSESEGELAEKCRDFLEMLGCWRKQAKALSISELIATIINDTGMFAYVEALSGGKNRRANIELFTECARQFEDSELRGIFAFTQYIDNIKNTRKDPETAKILSDACDVVRIMTIHKSKGLEFPVVFVMNCGGKINTKDWVQSSYVLHKQYGIGCNYLDEEKNITYPLISRKAISYKLKLENLSEEMRVLYVALTRAREKLFITVSGSANIRKIKNANEGWVPGKAKAFQIENAGSYLDWILLAFKNKHGENNWETTFTDSIILREEMEKAMNAGAPEEAEGKTHGKYAELVNSRLSYKYEHKKSSSLAAKFSVTEVKHKMNTDDDGKKFVFEKKEPLPKFMAGEKMSASHIGSVYHLVLRFVDLKEENKKAALDSCKKMLSEKGFVSERELKEISDSVILSFLESDIARKMLEAEKLYRELPFNIAVGGDVVSGDSDLVGEKVLLQGIIDCLFVTDGKCYILDYKKESMAMSESELVEIYRPQLDMYEIAAEKITGCKVAGKYLYFLSRGKLAVVDNADKI